VEWRNIHSVPQDNRECYDRKLGVKMNPKVTANADDSGLESE